MTKDRIKVQYKNYNDGKNFYTNLSNYITQYIEKTDDLNSEYQSLDSSIFDISSFPVNIYISDLSDSFKNSQRYIENSLELAGYVVDNFKGAEEAIEEDINKFKNKMEELFGNISFDGFHFESENIVYWEPGTDGYTAQGYTETEKYKVISAYKDGAYSRLYYYDKETGEFVGYVILNNKAHVGGTAYDPDDDIIFVTGEDGKVNCYDHKVIEDALEIGKKELQGTNIVDLNDGKYPGVEVECNIDIKDELKTKDAATIYYHDGKLYVGTYRTKGDLVSYDINCNRKENGKIDLETGEMHVVSHDCPSAVQGISIFEKDGKKYVAFARSAKLSPSSIDVYELNDDDTLGDMSGSISIAHKGLEGIEVHDDGSITGIYEYEGATTLDDNIDKIIGNGKKNEHDIAYYNQAYFWNMFVKKNGNVSYEDAMIKLADSGYY